MCRRSSLLETSRATQMIGIGVFSQKRKDVRLLPGAFNFVENVCPCVSASGACFVVPLKRLGKVNSDTIHGSVSCDAIMTRVYVGRSQEFSPSKPLRT